MEHKADAIFIPKETIKWVALFLVLLNVFSFSMRFFVAPAFAQATQRQVVLQGGDNGGFANGACPVKV